MEEFSNPFDEEFELSDVVNKGEIDSGISQKKIYEKKDPNFLKDKLSQDDLDKIINYDNQKRKKNLFKNKINDELELEEGEFDKINNFKDFLLAPVISGKGGLKGDAHIYPQSKVIKSDKRVEITSTPADKTRKHDKASVIVNRDESGDLENIEILCACGEMILLKFDQVDNLAKEETTKILSKKIDDPIPFGEESKFEDIEKGSLTTGDRDDEFINENIDAIDDDPFELKEEKSESIEDSDENWESDFGVDDEELNMGDIDLSGI